MTFSIYSASVPVCRETLEKLLLICDKAVAHAEAHGTDPGALLEARLYPDMYPLAHQARGVAVLAMRICAQLGGGEPPLNLIDLEKPNLTFDDLKRWFGVALDYLSQVRPEALAGADGKEIVFPLRNVPCTFTGASYLLRFGLPNLFFHTTVFYAILRHNGVPVGKSDFVLPEFAGVPAHFPEYRSDEGFQAALTS